MNEIKSDSEHQISSKRNSVFGKIQETSIRKVGGRCWCTIIFFIILAFIAIAIIASTVYSSEIDEVASGDGLKDTNRGNTGDGSQQIGTFLLR